MISSVAAVAHPSLLTVRAESSMDGYPDPLRRRKDASLFSAWMDIRIHFDEGKTLLSSARFATPPLLYRCSQHANPTAILAMPAGPLPGPPRRSRCQWRGGLNEDLGAYIRSCRWSGEVSSGHKKRELCLRTTAHQLLRVEDNHHDDSDMCILLLSTAHPDYPLVLLNNRDEFLHRPTQRASFWDAPHASIFSGRDLARPEKGTWLGVSRDGRIACLTNFREPSSALAIGQKSRGAMITSWLTAASSSSSGSSHSTKEWIHELLSNGEMKGVGGFSMLCGTLRPANENLQELAVISNRSAAGDDGVEEGAAWIGSQKGQSWGLSNSLFEDPWPKIGIGKELLEKTIQDTVANKKSETELIESLFGVLSHDTMPLLRKEDDTYEAELDSLRYSVFIPAFNAALEHGTTTPPETANGKPTADEIAAAVPSKLVSDIVDASQGDSERPMSARGKEAQERFRDSPRLYGTQSQTVILVRRDGMLKYVERTLYDHEARPLEEKERDVVQEFMIEGW